METETCTNNENENENTHLLFYSSLIFMTNTLATFYKKYYIYSFLFFVLTITSVIFHSEKNIYTNLLDKLAIFTIVSYGAYMLYNKINKDNYIITTVVVAAFLSCIFLFTYGYFTNQYCYDPNENIGDMFHCLLHFISSIGHHFIAFL